MMNEQQNNPTAAPGQETQTSPPRKTRPIVRIDEDKCDGCGLCVPACAEGAIQIIDGKARLVAENLCDGIGNCLGTCPQDAIIIENRDAEQFDEQAVEKHLAAPTDQQSSTTTEKPAFGGCPGALAQTLKQNQKAPAAPTDTGDQPSQLGQWPIQLHLVPPTGDRWENTDVLIAADCTAFTLGGFHNQLLAGKTLIIACPKLDGTDEYLEKLTTIFQNNPIKSITVARMEVPCCMGLTRVVAQARAAAGKDIPFEEVIVTLEGALRYQQ